MAEEEKEAESKPTGAKAGSRKLLLMVGGVIALIVLIGAPVLYFTVFAQKPTEQLDPDAAMTDEETASLPGNLEEDELEEGEEPVGALYPMEAFVLNLQDGKFIRSQIQLEFTTRDVPKRFYSRQVLVRDAIITLLTSKTSQQLIAEDGKEKLKTEVRSKANEVLKDDSIKNIYLTQFVIQ